MKTTMTIDDDVAALLRRLLKARHITLKQLVNDALRRGLRSLSVKSPVQARFVVEPLPSGPCLLSNVDCIGAVLALIEGQSDK